MLNYFLRRLLLVPVTFVVITFMVYGIMRWAPGGPIEQLERQLKSQEAGEAGGGPAGITGDEVLDEDAKEELRRYYNLDKSIPVGYLEWLGVKPRTLERAVPLEDRSGEQWRTIDALWKTHRIAKESFEEALAEKKWVLTDGVYYWPVDDEHRSLNAPFFAGVDALAAGGPAKHALLVETLEESGYLLRGVVPHAPVDASSPEQRFAGYYETLAQLRTESDDTFKALEMELVPLGIKPNKRGRYYYVTQEFSGVLEGDFGHSFVYSKPSLEVITDRFPVSIYFGLIGYLASWIICVPLGVFKAIRHRSLFDTVSSVVVFLGYATPGFVACLLLLVWFGGSSSPPTIEEIKNWQWFPLGDFRSPGWNEWWGLGEYWRCVKDQLHHTIVPVFGFLVASFASMTVVMKNSLLENLGADYVRTAFAKGLPEKRVIFVHALRNSLIPITAGVGSAIGLLFAGSFLIEKTCNIDGMGKLGLTSLLARDYPVTLGILVFGVLIRLFGNMLSDLIWAVIDPRIRFK